MGNDTSRSLAETLGGSLSLRSFQLQCRCTGMSDDASMAWQTALRKNVSLRSFQVDCDGWDLDLPITDMLSRNRCLPVQWLAVACCSRYAASFGVPENDLRRLIFRFF